MTIKSIQDILNMKFDLTGIPKERKPPLDPEEFRKLLRKRRRTDTNDVGCGKNCVPMVSSARYK